eukprot:1125820-Pleurochrysis_carterae.AAC.1
MAHAHARASHAHAYVRRVDVRAMGEAHVTTRGRMGERLPFPSQACRTCPSFARFASRATFAPKSVARGR